MADSSTAATTVASAEHTADEAAKALSQTAKQAARPGSSRDPEPRWPAVIGLFAVGCLQFALPESLSAGPRWMLLIVVAAFTIPITISRRLNNHTLNAGLGYILNGLVTLDMVWSLGKLLVALPAHKESPLQLLGSAAALWLTNILVFASWYWRLDGGGPNARDKRGVHTDGAFLFPQMTLSPDARRTMGEQNWAPGFIDYLFVAFNTSTAFSPTDCPVLSRWAKVLMMVQALISFATVVLLAARAVNIL